MQSLSTLFTHPLPGPIEPVIEEVWKGCRALIRELYDLQKSTAQKRGAGRRTVKR
jgi:hypothetical protein